MYLVASSEHAVLSVARAVVGQLAPESVESVLRERRDLPERFHPRAVRLLEQTLSRGTVLALARRGGWRRVKHLGPRGVVEGRLWQRHKPPRLRFGPSTMLLCRWLAQAPLGAADCPPLTIPAPLTLADELFLYLTCDLLARLEVRLGANPAVTRSPLAWLGFPELLSDATPPSPAVLAASFQALAAGEGALVLEALQGDLSRRWLAVERSKRRIRAIPTMSALGAAQHGVLEPFLDGIDRAGRRDLAGFLVDVAAQLGRRATPAGQWVERLESVGPLRERVAARRAAGATMRAFARLQRWDAEHRGVRFFDDNYETAQLLLTRWEAASADTYHNIDAILRELDSLDPAAGAETKGSANP